MIRSTITAGILMAALVIGLLWYTHAPNPRATTPTTPPTTRPNTSPSTTPPTASTTITRSPARIALDTLPVAPAASMAGYTRDAFGQAWSDDVTTAGGHNGCDTANDIKRRDLTHTTIKPGTHGCLVLTGTGTDPFTGHPLTYHRGQPNPPEVDHLIALAAAWRTGAQTLTPDQRRNFANDPLNLTLTSPTTNALKADNDAGGWLPPEPNAHCTYATRQIAVKTAYHLWVTPTEKTALRSILDTCTHQQLPTDTDWAPPPLN